MSTVSIQREGVDATRGIAELARAANDLTRLGDIADVAEGDRLYHETFSAVHRFLVAAGIAEREGASLDEMRAVTAGARAFVGRQSETIAHTQTWPRGYPGDFEIVERMLNGVPEGQPGTLRYALDHCMLQLPIVSQHRAKVLWQAQLVRRGLGTSDALRVLSIACGGSRDLMCLEPYELAKLDLTLTDYDAAALALSRHRLSGRVRGLRCIKGNALRSARQLRAAGPFDIVLVGGLLDYLPHRAAGALLKQAVTMLAPGGRIGATNIAAPNPFRLWLELIAGWSLIARDRLVMRELVRDCGVSSDVVSDHTGLTWLLTLSTGT